MPTYQYACTSDGCGTEFELVQTFTDPAASECPECAGPVRKVFSAVGVVFKGSGLLPQRFARRQRQLGEIVVEQLRLARQVVQQLRLAGQVVQRLRLAGQVVQRKLVVLRRLEPRGRSGARCLLTAIRPFP